MIHIEKITICLVIDDESIFNTLINNDGKSAIIAADAKKITNKVVSKSNVKKQYAKASIRIRATILMHLADI